MAGLFGGNKPTPALTPPPVMPDPQSPEARLAQRKTLADATGAGRSSTTLTQAGAQAAGTIAGGAGTKLGA